MAITFDAATGQKVTSATTNTFSHTVAVQNNRIILVSVDAGTTVNSVTYGGTSLTQLAIAGSGETLSLWYLVAPATGANNVVITCASSTFIIGASASYYVVAQSSTFGTAATNTGSGATSSTNTVATTSSSQLVYDVVNNTGAATDTATASQTKRFQPTSSGVAEGDIAATGSNMTLTWSWTGSASWLQISVAMNPAVVALSGTLAGVGTFSGTFSFATSLSAQVNGVGALSGTLSTSAPSAALSGALAGVGTLSAILTVAGSLTITVGGNLVAFDESTFKLMPKLDEVWRLQCTLLDYAGTTFFQYGEKVVVTDPSLGVLFTGFLSTDIQDKSNTYPDTTIEHQIDCIDGRYLVDKRTSNRLYTAPTPAGKIVVDMLHDVLTAEGIISHYALQYLTTQADWAQGTLSNTSATLNVGDGDLELAPSGTSVTAIYNNSTQWNTGTLSNVRVNGNDLSLIDATRNWNDGNKANQTLFGQGALTDQVVSGIYELYSGVLSETSSRMDFAGTYAAGTIAVDCDLSNVNGLAYMGVSYLTTNWNNNANTYAYAVEFSRQSLFLSRGTNGGAGGSTSLASYTFPTILSAAVHTLEVIFGSGSHHVYVDGTLYLTASDSTYTSAGYVALRNRAFCLGPF